MITVVYKLTGIEKQLTGSIEILKGGLLLLDCNGNKVDISDIDYCVADRMSGIEGYDFYIRYGEYEK